MNTVNANRFVTPVIMAIALSMGAVVAAAPSALGQSAKLDLSALNKLARKASNVTNVSLGPDAVALAAGHVSGKQQKLLQRLKGIYVRDYEFSKPGEYSRRVVEGILRQLHQAGWKALVNVEEKKTGEVTDIYIMREGGETVGMAILDVEPKELTVVNLVGPMNLAELGGLGGNFHIPPLALQHRGASSVKKPAAKPE